MVALNFDATNIATQKAFTLLPPGRYLCKIIASEMKPTKDGAGQYLQLTHEVSDGAHAGSTFTNNLNLENANAQTVDIAYKTLSTICHHIGKIKIKDSKELHNQPIIAILEVESKPKQTGDGTFESNRIKGYDKASADSVSTSSAPTAGQLPAGGEAAQPTTQQAAGNKPAWATKK